MEKQKKAKTNKIVLTSKQKKRIILNIVIIAVVAYILYAIYLLIKEPTNIFTIEEGTLYQEETDIGYVIRKEIVVRGNNYKNGMEQIKAEGEKAAKDENIFRYYSTNEENLKEKIAELDTKIQTAMTEDTSIFSADMKLLEDQIDEKLEKINEITDVTTLTEGTHNLTVQLVSDLEEIIQQQTIPIVVSRKFDARMNFERKMPEQGKAR